MDGSANQRRRWAVALAAVALATASAACGSATGAAATPSSAPPVSAPSAAATPSGTASYGDWVARQGFGGSSGLRELRKGAIWITEHWSEATIYDIDDWAGIATGLRAWLGEHDATACWQGYRSSVVGELDAVLDAFAAVRAARSANEAISPTVAAELVHGAQAAFDTPAPAGCP